MNLESIVSFLAMVAAAFRIEQMRFNYVVVVCLVRSLRLFNRNPYIPILKWSTIVNGGNGPPE
jgi:hypothetical protein